MFKPTLPKKSGVDGGANQMPPYPNIQVLELFSIFRRCEVIERILGGCVAWTKNKTLDGTRELLWVLDAWCCFKTSNQHKVWRFNLSVCLFLFCETIQLLRWKVLFFGNYSNLSQSQSPSISSWLIIAIFWYAYR